MSIPAADKTDAHPCGFVDDKRREASPVESEPLIQCVPSMYSFSLKVGHMLWYSGEEGKK